MKIMKIGDDQMGITKDQTDIATTIENFSINLRDCKNITMIITMTTTMAIIMTIKTTTTTIGIKVTSCIIALTTQVIIRVELKILQHLHKFYEKHLKSKILVMLKIG